MNLEDIRREYQKNGLRRAELVDDPVKQLEKWLAEATGVELVDPTAMTLATVNAKGEPSQRVVLLKHLDSSGLVFYTNLNSAKAKDIDQNKNVSAHFAWLPLERQVKIKGVAEKLSATEAFQYFTTRPRESQLAAWSSPQSSPISSRAALMAMFAKMKEKFSSGQIPLPDFWGGYRIIPRSFEFWQGGTARLHDRFVYTKTPDGWSIQRLAP